MVFTCFLFIIFLNLYCHLCRHEGHSINFYKSGNLGIQVAGGNAVGIFAAAVKQKSAAAKAGLKQGDLILEVMIVFVSC